jgi:GAF domain-containing protein
MTAMSGFGSQVLELSRSTIERMSALQATVDDVHRAVCRDIVDHIGATRASIWYFNAAGDTLTSACMVDSRVNNPLSGDIIREAEYGSYFKSMRENACINAPEALTHSATSCFRETYLEPQGIMSLLDFVIKVRGQSVAVLCCEHCEETKHWTNSDEEYLHQMAILLSLSIMIGRHVQA